MRRLSASIRPRNQRLLFLIWMPFLFVFFLILNWHTQMVADDFIFSYSIVTWTPITSVRQIIPNLVKLYNQVNGRVFSHFFAMFFLLEDKIWFNLINAAFSTLLFAVLLRYLPTENEQSPFCQFVFVFGAIWFFLPAFGQVFLWLTGSCNYSWTMLVSFLYLLPFFRFYREGKHFPSGLLPRSLYLLLSFLAGAWSENGGLAVLFSAFCFWLAAVRRDRRLPVFLSIALLLGVCGFSFLMLAPSELGGRRGNVEDSTLTLAALHLFQRFPVASVLGICFLLIAAILIVVLFIRKRHAACRFASIILCVGVLSLIVLCGIDHLSSNSGTAFFRIMAFLSDTRILLLLAFGLWGILMLYSLDRGVPAQTMLAALILGLSAFASIAVFLFAAYFPARSACPSIFYTTLSDALLLSALSQAGKRKPQRILSAIFTILFALTVPFAVNDVLHTDRQLRQRKEYLTEFGIANPHAEALVDPVTPYSKYPACWPGDEDYFIEETGWYYNLNAVIVKEYVN